MKNFQDFWHDMLADTELKLEVKRALGLDSEDITEAQYPMLVELGKAHGYTFTEEDIHFARAASRKLDDNELITVSGGGMDDDDECFIDYGCQSSQITTHHDINGDYHGYGMCSMDYACRLAYNSCRISNKCYSAQACNGEAH